MRLYFLRHGLADRSAWSGDDYLRPLTPEGHERMEREGRSMKNLRVEVDVLLSSPLTRALQTAEIAAKHLGVEVTVDERLGFGFGRQAIRDVIAEHKGAQAIMFVGHEPDFSSAVSSLTGGDVVCKKGSLARIDLYDTSAPAGELVWLLQPRVLARRID